MSDRLLASWLLIAGSAALAWWYGYVHPEALKRLMGRQDEPAGSPAPDPGKGSAGAVFNRVKPFIPPPTSADSFPWPSSAQEAFKRAFDRGEKVPGYWTPDRKSPTTGGF